MVNLNNILKAGDKSELHLNEFSIRNKCIIFKNTCIQISNIASLQIFSIKDNFPRWTIIVGLLGLMMITSPAALLGLVLIGWSGYVIYNHVTKSEDHLLQILTNNGYTYSILSKNKEFGNHAIEVITNVINNESVSNYRFDMKNCVIVDTVNDSVVNFQSEIGGDVSNTTAS